MKYRAASALLFFLPVFILFAIIPRTFHLYFLSTVLIVFIDHVRRETILREYFSLRLGQIFMIRR